MKEVELGDGKAVAVGAPVLEPPPSRATFPSSLGLTLATADALKTERYCTLVGILGAPDAGKTAIVVALYLLLAKNNLPSFEYADSRTLMALDQISRGARRWNEGAMPDDLTTHTKAPDERTAGFLHLRLRHRLSGSISDVLLPDLPGEWSSTLISSNRTDRLGFLKAADVLWLVLDGRELRDRNKRQRALHHAQLLMQRVSTFLAKRIPPMVIVITRRDLGEPTKHTVEALEAEALKRKIPLNIISISSFSDGGEVPAGFGIDDLFIRTLDPQVAPVNPFWSNGAREERGHRAILRIKGAARI